MTAIPMKMQPWYSAIIDILLSNPQFTQLQIAAQLGRTPQYLGHIMRTDMFKAALAERRAELNSALADNITTKNMEVANVALDLVKDRIINTPKSVPTALAAEVAQKALEASGYSAKKPDAAAAPVNVNITVGADVISGARDKLRQVEATKMRDVTATAVTQTPQVEEKPNAHNNFDLSKNEEHEHPPEEEFPFRRQIEIGTVIDLEAEGDTHRPPPISGEKERVEV